MAANLSQFSQNFQRVLEWLDSSSEQLSFSSEQLSSSSEQLSPSSALQGVDCRDLQVRSILVDSRFAKQNGLFFALAGQGPNSRDGHEYLEDAVAGGARFLCIDRRFSGPIPPGAIVVRVDDTLKSLQVLARRYLASARAKVVAITGSVGKSTTTQLLGQLLMPHLPTGVSRGNQNGQIGVPLSILNELRPEHQWLVLEMGMDSPGQLANLVQIAPPEIAVMTTLSKVHMDLFPNLRALGEAKSEIFLSSATRIGILNAGAPHAKEMAQRGQCRKIYFGSQPSLNVSLWGQLSGQSLLVCQRAERREFRYPDSLAPHHLDSVLAALCAARQLPLTFEQISFSLAQVKGLFGRFCRHFTSAITLIDDTYNASALSTIGALTSLPAPKAGGRRFAVLAQMQELGAFAVQEHRRVAAQAALSLDALICLEPMPKVVFDEWQKSSKPIWRATHHAQVLEILEGQLKVGDVVLLKGSRKGQLDLLVQPLLKIGEQLAV